MNRKNYLSLILLLISVYAGLGQSNNVQYGAYNMPYVRYEADKGIYNQGALLKDVSYDQALTQSEASEKKYIELSDKNASVKWKVNEKSKGMTLRFTMPDSEEGKGLNGSLGVFVNGTKVGVIDLTSFYAWQYFDKSPGVKRDPVNDPKTGNPRMRFDEERFVFKDELQPGDELMLVKSKDDGIPYGVDFVELEPIQRKIEKPTGFVSVMDSRFGAKPNDNIDDTEAFMSAINTAKRTKTGVYIPEGKFLLSKNITIDTDGFVFQGAGIWYTHLHWTGYSEMNAKGGIDGQGSQVRVSDFYMTSNLNNRGGGYRAFNQYWGKNSIIENVWLSHFSVGFWTSDGYGKNALNVADHLTIRNCRIRNTYADGCNFARGARNCVLEYSSLRNNGDDAMATVSHQPELVGPCTNNVFRYNTVEFVARAAGLGIFGGEQHEAHHCVIKDVFAGAGIRVNSTFPAAPYVTTSTINIHDMKVERCGTRYGLWDNNIGAINLLTWHYDVVNVNLKDIEIVDAQTDAILVSRASDKAKMTSVYLENIAINGTGVDNFGEGCGIKIGSNHKGWIGIDNITFERIQIDDICENAAQFEIRLGSKAEKSINLSPAKISIEEGEVTQLHAKVFSLNSKKQQFTWFSSNPNIAKIDQNGLLTGLNPGNTTITVKHPNGLKAISNIEVLLKISPTNFYKIKNRINNSYLYQDGGKIKYGTLKENDNYYWSFLELPDGSFEVKNKKNNLYMHVERLLDHVELNRSWPVWLSRRWILEKQDDQWFCINNAWVGKRANIVRETGYLQYDNNPPSTNYGAQFTLEKVNVYPNDLEKINITNVPHALETEHPNVGETYTNNVYAYPNPTSGVFEISLPTLAKEAQLEIYTIQSQLISSEIYKIDKGKIRMNFENQPNGIYFLKVILEKPIVIKVIKN